VTASWRDLDHDGR